MARRTVLVQVNSLELGGTQLNAVDFAKAVEKHGYESVLYGPLDTLPASGPTLFDVAAERGVTLHGYDRTDGVLSGRARRVSSNADQIGADIVHVYGTWGEPRTAYWGPCRFGRRPFVHTVYEMSVDPQIYRHTSLIVGTRYLAEELAHRPGPTVLISPPVDLNSDAPDDGLATTFRRDLGEDGPKFLIVIVSRLDEAMKAFSVEVAIQAVRAVADIDAVLVVVGTGDAENRLRRLGARANEGAGRELVRFTGAIRDPRAAYASADVMLAMGGSAARGLAFGCPLIVQGEAGTSEVFEAATADSLFRRSFWSRDHQPDPAESLAGLIRSLKDNPDRRRELGLFGRAFAAENFGLEAMAERLASVYDRSIGRYGPIPWARDLNHELPEIRRSVTRRLHGGRAVST